jgi:methionyl-tRNA formyltransferase
VAAQAHGLPLHQTASINEPATLAALRESGAQALVVAAFGQLLRQQVLEEFLCLNVHASLLPQYRGAAPIARALMDGRSETGVTIMRMTAGLDEGPWVEMTRVSVSLRDDTGSLSRTLALLGSAAVDQVMTGCSEDTVTWREQQGEPSYARKLETADRDLDFTRPARAAHDQVRALCPDVGCRASTAGGLELKVWRSWPWPEGLPDGGRFLPSEAEPGQLAAVEGRLFLACADCWLELLSLQPVGKKAMTAADFLRGYERRLSGRLLPPAEEE